MKQFVQNLKVLRTMPGRFLAVAVLAATAFTFAPRAQADPGKGAVVTHVDRDRTGHYWIVSPDGQLRLDVVLSGQGDFSRLNPDGTLTWEIVEPAAPMTVSVLIGGSWVVLWEGSGSLHDTSLYVRENDGSWSNTRAYIHVEGKLTYLPDGSKWSLLVVAVMQDYEFKELKIELQPR